MVIHVLEVIPVKNEPILLHPNWKPNSDEFWESHNKAFFVILILEEN